MRELSCSESQELCPDVALGIADAEERAAVLAHVESCRSCRDELASSSDVADLLYVLVPPAEPPDGFASRVVDAISSSASTSSSVVSTLASPAPENRFRRRSYRRPLSVAAAVVLAAAIGVGGWLAAGGGSSPAGTVRTAALVWHDRQIGQVTTETGDKPWISVDVRLGTGTTMVRCEVADADGTWQTVGTFDVHNGHGYWAAPLPPGVSVQRAELTTTRGQVLASASLVRS